MAKIGIIVESWAGTSNLGDNAIFSGLLNLIRSKISRNASIFAIVANDKIIKANYDVDDSVAISESFRPSKLVKILSFLRRSNLLVFGGGDVVGGNIRTMLLLILAKILGIPIMFCGVGVIPVDNCFIRFVMRWILNSIELITVRDNYSLDILRKKYNIARPSVYVTGDLAFSMQPPVKNFSAPGAKLKVGVNVRPYSSMYSFYCPKWPDNVYEIIAEACDHLIDRYDANIVFFPLEQMGPYSDIGAIKKVIGLMRNTKQVEVAKNINTPQKAMEQISQVDLLIGFRLHALIFAVNVGLPVIGVSYAPKVESFLDAIQSPYIRVDELTKERIIKLVDRCIANPENHFADVSTLRRKSELNGELMARILSRRRKKHWRFYLLLPVTVPLVSIINAFYGLYQSLRLKSNI